MPDCQLCTETFTNILIFLMHNELGWKKSSEEKKTTVGYGDVHQFSDDNHQNLSSSVS